MLFNSYIFYCGAPVSNNDQKKEATCICSITTWLSAARNFFQQFLGNLSFSITSNALKASDFSPRIQNAALAVYHDTLQPSQTMTDSYYLSESRPRYSGSTSHSKHRCIRILLVPPNICDIDPAGGGWSDTDSCESFIYMPLVNELSM